MAKNKIILITKNEKRFGKSIMIAGTKVNVDEDGQAMVSEELVAHCINVGFELKDKNQEFESLDQQKVTQSVNDLLESARKQAEEIIRNAKEQAEQIITGANKQKVVDEVQNHTNEKKEVMELLSNMTLEQLKLQLKEAGVPEKDWKSIRSKQPLIEMAYTLMFPKD